ncbi:MAG: hypothetical protein HWD58_20230 [Bacteroidota bacterium]|nr:MAG: hypothetical protein HWD58_20230 [Bacteroidota bacterium]
MSITTYSNSTLEGYYSEFHFNGQLKEHGINKLNVPWTIYGAYDSLGNAIDIGNLLNGTGTIRKFYSNGKLMKIEQYNDGKYWNTLLLYSISEIILTLVVLKMVMVKQ